MSQETASKEAEYMKWVHGVFPPRKWVCLQIWVVVLLPFQRQPRVGFILYKGGSLVGGPPLPPPTPKRKKEKEEVVFLL